MNLKINLREPAANLSAVDKLASGTETPAELLSAFGVKDGAALLARFPAGSLASATLPELEAAAGRKAGRAVFAALALGRALAIKPATYLKPRDVWERLGDIRNNKKEHFVVFYLDTRNNEVAREIVSIGTLNYNLVHPREVFEPAVRNLSSSIIVAHNHPSGCLEPSDEDMALTKRLAQAGKLLGIELLDHIIVTADGFMSFKEKHLCL